MYTKIVKYERNGIGAWDKDYSSMEVLKEIKPTDNDFFENILKIDGKLYKPCSAYGEYIAVDEVKINYSPYADVRNENDVECPYCGFVDQDTHEFPSKSGETECANCESEIKYLINAVINSLGECLEVICHTGPVKLNEPIEI
ncbi:hypothetical protein [Bacillus thuringiensis]|uniref:Uncharacterized protein n=1 Tax=Bacillus thuringiensis DB27 TaxID=1431339 RepID=W8YA95_BACTU|nr:hypothetical protein [Bacillus thuringiensis]MBG9630829.1 hypothetical protein [Bacillus thuringiensis]MBG9668186.1 hypothetical protein [Bacillus thuringiensis]MBH0352482.1 hypothetical protein [Bacillus thuringiensis]CDN35567.1 unnamed protein product [Bacillus thuringiensis DB27]